MPVKLSTTIEKIDKIENAQNRFLVKKYHKFMDSTSASERHQNNNLKVILSYVNYLGRDNSISTTITKCDSILSFLETKKKTKKKYQITYQIYFNMNIFFQEKKVSVDRFLIGIILGYLEFISSILPALKIFDSKTGRLFLKDKNFIQSLDKTKEEFENIYKSIKNPI